MSLPFGFNGALAATTSKGTALPTLTLVQPSFPASSTPAGTVYTGAWQLSIAAPDPTQPDPILAGRSYLRNYLDDPPAPELSYGEQVLGRDVAGIFSTRFDANASQGAAGVPLRRYDLTGYGASTFSEWTNTNPHPTDVMKAHFHVLIGRTSHEIIEVQSIIYPWAIKVVRTITIDREGSGSVMRYDSGWQPASDGLFQYPAATNIPSSQIQAGLITGVINVSNIQELGFPVNATGTEDGSTTQETISLQPVTFNANVAIQPQHTVVQGGATMKDLNGNSHVCVPSTGITGFIGLTALYHLDMTDMTNFSALSNGAGGPINAILNVAQANSLLLRLTAFDATPVSGHRHQRTRPRVRVSRRSEVIVGWLVGHGVAHAVAGRACAYRSDSSRASGSAEQWRGHHARERCALRRPRRHLPAGSGFWNSTRNSLRIPAGYGHAEQLLVPPGADGGLAKPHARGCAERCARRSSTGSDQQLPVDRVLPAIPGQRTRSDPKSIRRPDARHHAEPDALACGAWNPDPADHLFGRSRRSLLLLDGRGTRPKHSADGADRAGSADTAIVVAGHQSRRGWIDDSGDPERPAVGTAGLVPRRRRYATGIPQA